MLTLQTVGLRTYNVKSLIGKKWTIIWSEETKVPILEHKYTTDYLLESNVVPSRYSFQQTPTSSNATKDIRFLNTMTSVTCFRG